MAAVEGQLPRWVCLCQEAASWHWGVRLAHQLHGSGPHTSYLLWCRGKPWARTLDAGVPWRWDAVGLLLLQNVPLPLAFRRNFEAGASFHPPADLRDI